MRNDIRYLLYFIFCLVLTTSCSNKFVIKPYFYSYNLLRIDNNLDYKNTSSYNNKSIILTSDSTLNYSIMLGGIGISTTITYKKIDNEITVDSIDIYNRESFQNITNEIFSRKFAFSKDSLVDLENQDIYYSAKYVKNKTKENKFKGVYIVSDRNKKRLNRLNEKRIMRKITSGNYDLTEISKEDAMNIYDIDRNYITFKLTKK